MNRFNETGMIKSRIARRLAAEFSGIRSPLIINLGVGIPTLVANYLNNENIFIQSENGMLGVGPLADESNEDPYLINAGRQKVTQILGSSYFDSAFSFGMIRGGHVDVTVIGAFEVDEKANIANWIIPNGRQLGVGGAMDLVAGARKVIIGMNHLKKDGKSKLVKACSLPITGCNQADVIITELGVFTFPDGKLTLQEITPEINIETLAMVTDANFNVSPELKIMTDNQGE